MDDDDRIRAVRTMHAATRVPLSERTHAITIMAAISQSRFKLRNNLTDIQRLCYIFLDECFPKGFRLSCGRRDRCSGSPRTSSYAQYVAYVP